MVTAAVNELSVSVGTLLRCASDGECLWAGAHGREVVAAELRAQLLAESGNASSDAERTLQQHMEYMERVHRYAQRVGHAFPFQMGVSARHLVDDAQHKPVHPEAFVERERTSWRARITERRLTAAANATATTSTNVTAALNWCSAENPQARSVCSSVKSQKKCGSCWAFAATDAIETAVAIASNQSSAVPLAPQQFLSCSRRATEETFKYCWAAGGAAAYAPWLSESMRWKSTNNACAGGMTHGAFIDAAQLHFGLVTELELPYDDKGANTSSATTNASAVCTRASGDAAASITGWKQAVGEDCSVSRNPSELLRRALQRQPIAVAVSSAYPFADYKGGFYSCPNGGDLATKNDVNHALVLVGYGSDVVHGDYWILKNSYGSAWGDSGFMKLLADAKTNCGLNIFPVVPVGAKAGRVSPGVDGGGAKRFVGLALSAWLALAIATAVLTAVFTVVGVWWSRKQRAAIRAQASGIAAAAVYVAHE